VYRHGKKAMEKRPWNEGHGTKAMEKFVAAAAVALAVLLCRDVSSRAEAVNPRNISVPGMKNGWPSVPQSGPDADSVKRTLAKIKLPPGFHIELYAMIPGARHMAVGPRTGALFVGTTGVRMYVARPGSAAADGVWEFAPALRKNMPNGPCFAPDGTLFVTEQNRVLMFPNAENFIDGADLVAVPVVAQGGLIPRAEQSSTHSTRVCRVGPDDKLYITLGQPFNVPAPEKLDGFKKEGIGGIIRMTKEGKDREVFAWGVRNSVGMDFNPKDKTLWFTDNQVDGMGDDQPPGELNRADKPGMNFGFPYYGGGKTRTTEYKDQQAPAGVTFPQVEMAAHAADLGMHFYSGKMFPAKYRGGIFSAQHGSWNRTVPVGARVMFTSLKEDGTADKTEPFAEGWNDNGEYLGRPVDVAQLPDGSLLVSDDLAGALYRIWYDGK
jgi:glucose/arabinose dehydrogenase